MPGKPAPLAVRFWAKVQKDTQTQCWLWKGAHDNRTGYGTISVQLAPRMHVNMFAHRIAWELTHGLLLPGFLVCHNCPQGDNPRCVNPQHLFIGTHGDNARDAWQKQRMPRMQGESNGHAKLTEADIQAIVALRGVRSQREIGRQYGIHQASVKDIQLGRRWGHLTRDVIIPLSPSEAARKLTPQHVYVIRALQGRQSQRDTARQFRVSQQQVSRIQRRIDWEWLPEQLLGIDLGAVEELELATATMGGPPCPPRKEPYVLYR